MANSKVTIFVAPPAVAKIAGRYICLVEGQSGEPETYFYDDSIVEIARQLGDKVTDWPFVENALNENGVCCLEE